MKRKLFLLSILLIFVSGCSVVRLDNNSFDKNIDVLLSQKNKNYNVNFDGYKYNVPYGLKFIKKEEYNAILLDKFDNTYYLYVDAIAYFHKVDVPYKKEDSYYTKELKYGNKSGYINILKIDDNRYFVEFVYNYAKLESYVSKNNLDFAINNMCYILRSIKYNDDVLESLIGENVLSYKEETFNLFDEQAASSDEFLEVVGKYDSEYSKSRDQDELELNDD